MNLWGTLGWILAVSCFTSCKDDSSSVQDDTGAESSWNKAAEARLNEQEKKNVSTAVNIVDELFAEDSFEIGSSNYLADTLLSGQNPVVLGFEGKWLTNVNNTTISVFSDGLEYPNLKSSGGKIGLSNKEHQSRNGRRLVDSYTDLSKEVVYISFLFQIENIGEASSYRAFELHDRSIPNSAKGFHDVLNRKFALGVHENDFGTMGFGFRVNNDLAFSRELLGFRDTNVNLFVLKFELSDKRLSDSVTVWMNPPIGMEGDPENGVSVSGFDISFDTVTLARFGGFETSLDELRIGNSYSAVTPTK